MADEVARLRIETATDDLTVAAQKVERLKKELEAAQSAVNAAGPGWEKQAAAVAKLAPQLEAAERAVKKKQLAVASAMQTAERADAADAARAQREVERAEREAAAAQRKADAVAREAKRQADAQIREAERAAAAERARFAAGPASLAGGEATEQIMVGARTFRGGMRGGQWDAQKYATDLAKGASANRDFGNAALQAAFMIDDMQYGIRGIINNIPMLTMAFGAGAGVTGAISIAGVAVSQLVSHWDRLADVLGQPTVKTAAEEIKYLGDMTERTAEQTARLNTLRAQDAFRKQQEQGTQSALTARSDESAVSANVFGDALKRALEGSETGTDLAAALTERAVVRQREREPNRPADRPAIEAEVQRRMGGAQAGNEADLTAIRDLAAGESGLLGRFSQLIEQAIESPRQQARADAAAGNSANARRSLETDLGNVQSADDFIVVMDRINRAIRDSSVTDEDAAALLERAADIRRKALDAERENVAKVAQINRDKETEELNRQGAANEAGSAKEIAEAERLNARKEARKAGRLSSMEEAYGAASAGGLMQNMLAEGGRGVDPKKTDQDLVKQMQKRLANAPLTDEQRLDMAANIVQRQREQLQDMQFQQGLQGDIADQQAAANFAPKGTTLGTMQRQAYAARKRAQASGGLAPKGTLIGVAQRQALRRQGIDPDAVQRMAQMNAGKPAGAQTPEQKQQTAAEKFEKAADKIAGAAEKMANPQIIL